MATQMIKQTIMQKKVSFSKLVIMILGGLLFISIIIRLLSPFGALAARIVGLLVFIAALAGSIIILYKHIAYFHYQLFEDELMMEKVFGRANHVFLNVKLDEIDFFESYQQAKAQGSRATKAKEYRFVSGKNSEDWYVGEFLRNGKRYRFIIAPNEELLKAIHSFIGNKKSEPPCCIRK